MIQFPHDFWWKTSRFDRVFDRVLPWAFLAFAVFVLVEIFA